MSDILDLIDGAIWEHGDAMRWTPEPVEDEDSPAEPWIEVGYLRRAVIDEIHHWNAADVARIFQVPAELLEPIPPRGIITSFTQHPQVTAPEPDLIADLIAFYRRLFSEERP